MNLKHLTAVEVQSARGEYKYIHGEEEGISTAFEFEEKASILLKIPRSLGTTQAFLEIYEESVCYTVYELEGEWCGIDGEFDEYLFDIPLHSVGCGLFYARPRAKALSGFYYGHKWKNNVYYDRNVDKHGMLQITICDFKYVESKKLRGGVIYHVFVDRFKRKGPVEVPDGAKIIPGSWRIIPEYPEYPGAPLYNNCFFGGTLWGVIEKLDYIKSLGTSAIYLSPIFRAASNHKYDTADYMEVDPIFGGEPALKMLINECKKRDIGIILDGVFNHTGSDSIYFNKYGRYQQRGAHQSKNSKYYSWYKFEQFPNKYECWWGIDILPRINPDIPECGDYFAGVGGVIEKYSKMGIYGFRLDVADELSDGFISRIKYRLSENLEDNILYGEVWEDASNKTSYNHRRRYYLGSELDGVMNYPLRSGIIDYLTGAGTEKLEYAIFEVTSNAPNRVLHNQMNLLGTHDTDRIITVLAKTDISGLNNHEIARKRLSRIEKDTAIKKLKCAYTILATMPGIPTIFYGDEAGLEGYKDPFNRMPYPWGNENKSLVEHYKTLGEIRNNNDVYVDGNFKVLHIDKDLLVFTRYNENSSFITIVNNSDKHMNVVFDDCAIDLLNDNKDNSFIIKSQSALIFKTEKNSTFDIN